MSGHSWGSRSNKPAANVCDEIILKFIHADLDGEEHKTNDHSADEDGRADFQERVFT